MTKNCLQNGMRRREECKEHFKFSSRAATCNFTPENKLPEHFFCLLLCTRRMENCKTKRKRIKRRNGESWSINIAYASRDIHPDPCTTFTLVFARHKFNFQRPLALVLELFFEIIVMFQMARGGKENWILHEIPRWFQGATGRIQWKGRHNNKAVTTVKCAHNQTPKAP